MMFLFGQFALASEIIPFPRPRSAAANHNRACQKSLRQNAEIVKLSWAPPEVAPDEFFADYPNLFFRYFYYTSEGPAPFKKEDSGGWNTTFELDSFRSVVVISAKPSASSVYLQPVYGLPTFKIDKIRNQYLVLSQSRFRVANLLSVVKSTMKHVRHMENEIKLMEFDPDETPLKTQDDVIFNFKDLRSQTLALIDSWKVLNDREGQVKSSLHDLLEKHFLAQRSPDIAKLSQDILSLLTSVYGSEMSAYDSLQQDLDNFSLR